MMPRLHALLLLALASSVAGQQREATIGVRFRVTAVRPAGRLVIDRGSTDKIAIDDIAFVLPRDGGRLRGKVVELEARSAVLELERRDVTVAAGTRGEFRVPNSRFRAKPAGREQQKPRADPEKPGERDPPRWRTRDEGWRPGMPLLSKVRPVRPEDRAWKMAGRIYSSGSLSRTPHAGSSDSFVRVGADLSFSNLFAAGGELRIDAETNYKTEQNGIRGADVLIRRLGYTYGGTRFSPHRVDVGRFLHGEVPEFGVVDGAAWSHRLENGDRFGVSLGFLPEPDDDYESFSDLQLAGFYKWVADEHEIFSVTGGFQKTFHSGHNDRDLIVGKLDYLPGDGWDAHASIWVDLYTGNDPSKNRFAELTQGIFTLGRRFDDGSGIDVSLWHQMFPDILRRQNRPLTANRLSVDRHDRLTLSAWTPWGENSRLRGTLAGWNDEDESGANIEAGFDVRELLFENGRSDLTVFASAAQFESAVGFRIATGRTTRHGRWDASYDFTYHHRVAFPSNFADIAQHRWFAEHEFALDDGWDLSTWADANLWDSDFSVALGFYLQKRF